MSASAHLVRFTRVQPIMASSTDLAKPLDRLSLNRAKFTRRACIKVAFTALAQEMLGVQQSTPSCYLPTAGACPEINLGILFTPSPSSLNFASWYLLGRALRVSSRRPKLLCPSLSKSLPLHLFSVSFTKRLLRARSHIFSLKGERCPSGG